MVRTRKAAPLNPPEPDFATVVADLQRQLLEQQQETDRLRAQIAQMNRGPQVNEVPPRVQPVPPVVPQVPNVHPEAQPEAQPEIPRNAEIPMAPVRVQVNPPVVREDLLYERFRRMKAPEFEGPTDPIAADNWLIDVQVILDFMQLTEQEKVLCASFALKKDARHWWRTVQMRRDIMTMTWQDFVNEFRAMYYNKEVLAVQQDEFSSFRQGTMTVMEAVRRFEQLARLCPTSVQNEEEKVRLMMKMFRADIAKQVSAGSSPPRTVSDCISRAIRAEYWINRDREARAQFFKARKEEKAGAKQNQSRQDSDSQPRGQANNPMQDSKQSGRSKRKGNSSGQAQQENFPQKRNSQGNENGNNDYPMCSNCGRRHPGVCKIGSTACYQCGKEGHYSRNCPLNSQIQNPPYPSRNNNNQQLHAIQAQLEGPSIAQGRLEAPEPQTRIYAYTNGDPGVGTSHVVMK